MYYHAERVNKKVAFEEPRDYGRPMPKKPLVTKPASKELQQRLRKLVDEMGEWRAYEELGLNRLTFARALAGLPLRPGSIALIERAIDARHREKNQGKAS